MSKIVKEKGYKYLILAGYVLTLIPFLYAVFYSMPANDDFAWAIEWFSSNRLVELKERIVWNYMNFFGQSGVIALIIQILFNPLYWFKNSGHSFGICMMIFFALLYVGYIISIKRIAKYLLHMDDIQAEVFTFLTAMIIFTAYYYADVYNWWSGLPGYSLLMLVMLVFFGSTAKYYDAPCKKQYIIMTVLGVIVCTGMMNCVPVGAFYVINTFIIHKDNGDKLSKKLLPLILFIISGVCTVIAPGNFTRTNVNDGKVNYVKALYVTAYDIIERLLQTMIHKPWIIALFLVIVVLGIFFETDKKPRLGIILFSGLSVFVSVYGAIYPYIAGERKEIGRELASRILFVEDYVLYIGMAIVLYAFGQYIGCTLSSKKKSYIMRAGNILAVCFVAIAIVKGTITTVVPFDIVAKRETIKNLYYIWDDILNEIEASNEKDVVIERHNVPWTQYSYVVGLDEGNNRLLDWTEGYYGTCNTCASIWYNKDSIAVYIYND